MHNLFSPYLCKTNTKNIYCAGCAAGQREVLSNLTSEIENKKIGEFYFSVKYLKVFIFLSLTQFALFNTFTSFTITAFGKLYNMLVDGRLFTSRIKETVDGKFL